MSDKTVFVPGAGKIHPASMTEPINAEARKLRAPHDSARRKARQPFPGEKLGPHTTEVVEGAEDANGGVSDPAVPVVANDEAALEVSMAHDEAPADEAPSEAEARAALVEENLSTMSKPQLKVLLDNLHVSFKSKDDKAALLRLAQKALTPDAPANE